MDSNGFDRRSGLEDTSEELVHIDTLSDAENSTPNFAQLRDDIAEILWTISQPESTQASDYSPDFPQEPDSEPDFELSDFDPSEFDLSGFEVNDSIRGLPSSISSRATHLPENLVSMEEAEGDDTLNTQKITDFSRAIRPGSHILPPLEYPKRPSTISRMKDNVNFDISEFFDLDAAAAPETPNLAQFSVNTITGGQSSNAIPPSGTPQDIYSPSVDFPEYLRQSQNLSMRFNHNTLADKRNHQKLPVTSSVNEIAAVKLHNSGSKAANKDDCFKNAFKAGAKDGFLPAMSDPLYDAEFAAFAAAGIKTTTQSSKEPKKRVVAPVPPEDVNYTKISQIYVSDILRRESELLGKPSTKPSPYTAEQVHWAKNYLTDEAKAWLRNACDANTIEGDTSPMIVTDNDQALQQTQNVAPSVLSASKTASQIPRLSPYTMSATSSGLPDYTCVRCDKDLTTKTHLLEHIAKNNCQAGVIKQRKVPRPAGASNHQSSMIDEDFVANGLPDLQAKSLRGLPYCEACGSEFSIVSRLRSHVQRSCPVLRERGIYDNSLPEIDNHKVNHFPLAGYSPQEQIESATGSDRNVTVGDLLAFNKSRNQSNLSANLLGAVRHLTQYNYTTGLSHRSSSHQFYSMQQGNSASPRLLEISNTKKMEGREQALKYPERVRLFSKEIVHTSPHMSDQLEEFEDLPQNTNRSNAQQSPKTSSGGNKISSQFNVNNASGKISTVYFVFTNKGNYAAAVRKLEALLLKPSIHNLQSLRLWPSPSVLPPQSKETFEFKVTATESVNLVTILREIFPDMVIKKLGKKVIFLRKVITPANTSTLAFNRTEAHEAVAVRPESDKTVENSVIEQSQCSSRLSGDLTGSVSQFLVEKKLADEQKGPNALQRRRSSSGLSEQRGKPENCGPSDKKRQKRN